MIVFDARKLGGYDVFFHSLGSSLYNRHSLPNAILSGAMATIFSYEPSSIAWLKEHILQSTAYFGGISFIVGFVVVYRSQISYQRYSEAQKSYFDMTSKLHDFISFANAFLLGEDEQTQAIRNTLIRWGRAYHELAIEEFQGIEFGIQHRANLTEEETQLLARDRKRMIQISSWMQRFVMENRDKFQAGDAILSRAFQIKSEANLHFNNVRRIAETPFPFPFVQLTGMMINLWSIMTPVVVGAFFPQSYIFSFLVSAAGTWILFAVNETAAQLEDPFDVSANNLPVIFYSIAFDDDMSAIKYMEYPGIFRQLKGEVIDEDHSEPANEVSASDLHVKFRENDLRGSRSDEENDRSSKSSSTISKKSTGKSPKTALKKHSSGNEYLESKDSGKEAIESDHLPLLEPLDISTRTVDNVPLSPRSPLAFSQDKSRKELLQSFRLKTNHFSLEDIAEVSNVSDTLATPFEDVLDGAPARELRRTASDDVLVKRDSLHNDQESKGPEIVVETPRSVSDRQDPPISKLFGLFNLDKEEVMKDFDSTQLENTESAESSGVADPKEDPAPLESVENPKPLERIEHISTMPNQPSLSEAEQDRIERMDSRAVLYHTVHGTDAAKMAKELQIERELQRRIAANRAVILRHKLREHKHEIRRHRFQVTSINSELPEETSDMLLPIELRDRLGDTLRASGHDVNHLTVRSTGQDSQKSKSSHEHSINSKSGLVDLFRSYHSHQSNHSHSHKDQAESTNLHPQEVESEPLNDGKRRSQFLRRSSSHTTKYSTRHVEDDYPGWNAESLCQIRNRGVFQVFN